MIKENQELEINIKYCKKYIKEHYEEKGYDIANDFITVKAEDLWKNSHNSVLVICDYCGKEQWVSFKDYRKNVLNGIIKKYSCKECSFYKRRESNLSRYGVKEYLERPEIQEKKINTCIEKYGGKSPMASTKVIQIRDEKFKEKYGVKNPSQVLQFQEKKAVTKYKNNSCACSKEQTRLATLFKGEINFPIGKYNVDILLEDKIILEYDGDGHDMSVRYKNISAEEFEMKEIQRRNFLTSQGYKLVIFKNLKWWDNITDEDYFVALEECKKHLNDNNWVIYDLNNKNLII